MPAAPLSAFDLGAGRVEVAADGCLATHPERPGFAYLTDGHGPPAVSSGSRHHHLRLLRRGDDLDEVELSYGLDDLPSLRLIVRHGFGATWVQRYTLDNTGGTPVELDRLTVPVRCGPGGLVWALAAGAEAFWTAQPDDGAGPVLAAVLQHGDVAGFDRDGWSTGPVRLAPQARYVVQWQLDWHASASAFERRRPSELPVRTELPDGEPCEIGGADAAVVVGSEVVVGHESGPGGETTVLATERPGRHRVELRSARGTVRFDVTWFRGIEAQVARAGERWLAGPRTPSGVVRLPGAAAGLVLQADHHRLADPAGEAVDALERLAAGVLDRGGADADVLTLALLAGEALRTGDADAAAVARDGVLARTAPEPGLGLAATRVGLAELAAARPIGPLIEHLAGLADLANPSDPSGLADPAEPAGTDATGGALAVAARLELSLISRPHGAVVDQPLLETIRTLGTAVGSGLPGASTRSWTADQLAYAAAVLAMVPEQGAGGLSRWCLRGPQALADLVRRRALAELTAAGDRSDELLSTTLAWLVLGQPPV